MACEIGDTPLWLVVCATISVEMKLSYVLLKYASEPFTRARRTRVPRSTL